MAYINFVRLFFRYVWSENYYETTDDNGKPKYDPPRIWQNRISVRTAWQLAKILYK